jgi:hypothetical protein
VKLKPVDRLLAAVLVAVLAVVIGVRGPAMAQSVLRIFGTTAAGAPIALRADASGNLKVAIQTVASLIFTNGTTLADTAGSGKLLITGTTPTVQFGGTTSGSPALRASGANLESILADASGYTGFTAASISANGNGIAISNSAGALFLGGGGSTKLMFGTAPSAPSACGTSPVVAASNGSVVVVITGGTGGTATGCTVTMPTAATGWACPAIVNITQTAAHRADRTTVQTASTTTSFTFEYQTVSTGAATAFTASDVFRALCFSY